MFLPQCPSQCSRKETPDGIAPKAHSCGPEKKDDIESDRDGESFQQSLEEFLVFELVELGRLRGKSDSEDFPRK